MATLIKEAEIDAEVSKVWDAVAAFGEIHIRLLPGLIADSRMEGEYRVLTFSDGRVLRERFVGRDDASRRLAYTIETEHLEHHNASLQAFELPSGRTRLVWTVDVLPDVAAATMSERLDGTFQAMTGNLSQDAKRED